MSNWGWIKQEGVNAALVGVNSLAINTSKDGSWVSGEGYNVVHLSITYTFAAGSGYQFVFQTSYGGTIAHPRCIEIDDNSGNAIITPKLYVRDGLAADDRVSIEIPICCKFWRLGSIIGTGSPNASDLLTVNAFLGIY